MPLIPCRPFPLRTTLPNRGRPFHSLRQMTSSSTTPFPTRCRCSNFQGTMGRVPREKHRIPPRCPFCGIESTRPEKIRRHLITQHRDRFSSEERQDIHHLQGWEATIHLLGECGRNQLDGRENPVTYHGQESRLHAEGRVDVGPIA